jgi:hypothetical protein
LGSDDFRADEAAMGMSVWFDKNRKSSIVNPQFFRPLEATLGGLL